MGWPVFAENRWWRENREIDPFAKWTFSRLFARFFGHPSWRPFFLHSGLLSSGNTAVEADTRETLQNKGFRSDVATFYIFEPFGRVDMARFCGPVLRIIFCAGYYFVRFDVRHFCRNWVSRAKKPLGLQNRARFEKAIFRSVSAACVNLARGGCAAVSFFSWIWGRCQKCPCGCGAEGFSVFSGFFFPTPFSKTSSGPLHIPLFFFGCFSLLFAFFLGWAGNAALHVWFWAVGLQPFLFFRGFWGLLRKALFFPWKRVIWVHFSVSPFCLPFVLLGFFHFSLSLSLSLFFFLALICFLVVLYLFSPSLFFAVLLSCFFVFCFMRRTTSKYYIWKLSFHNLFLFIFFFFSVSSFKYVLIFAFHYLSCVCWWTSMFFNISKKTISKTPILVLHIVKGYRFFRAHFDWGKFWLMFTKHYQNRYFSTLLRTINMNQIPFWGVVSGPSRGS